MNNFAKVCRSSSESKKKSSFGQLSSADESDSEESPGRIVVGKIDSQTDHWCQNYSTRTPKYSPCSVLDASNRHRHVQEPLPLGESDAVCPGIVMLDPKREPFRNWGSHGASICLLKPNPPSNGIVSGNGTQEDIDKKIKALINKFLSVFTDMTGNFKVSP